MTVSSVFGISVLGTLIVEVEGGKMGEPGVRRFDGREMGCFIVLKNMLNRFY